MSFRKSKSDAQHRSREWRSWIDEHRAEIVTIGLPPELYLDESHWSDFLENGHLHWHPSSGFDFGDLSSEQLAALHRFLEREFAAADDPPPLLNWVRVRCGTTGAE